MRAHVHARSQPAAPLTLNWFVIDTAISATHGVWINVAFNLVALGSIAIPLALMIPWLRARGGRG